MSNPSSPMPDQTQNAHGSTKRQISKTALNFLTALLATGLLLVLALTRWGGDRWWLATALLYTPRLIWLVPVIVLAGWAGYQRHFTLWITHLAMALVVMVPLMGFHFPLGREWSQPESDGRHQVVHVLTCNVGAGDLDIKQLVNFIESSRIDIICFQEIETRFLPELEDYFHTHGWFQNPTRTIASRLPFSHIEPHHAYPWKRDYFWGPRIDRVRVQAPDGSEFDALSIHLPTIRFGLDRLLSGDPQGLQDHIDWRREQLRLLLKAAEPEPGVPILLAGDFNTPSESQMLDPLRSVYRFCHERAGLGYGYTRPTAWPFLAIDHILVSPEWRIHECRVGPSVQSDHLPMMATLSLAPGRSNAPEDGH